MGAQRSPNSEDPNETFNPLQLIKKQWFRKQRVEEEEEENSLEGMGVRWYPLYIQRTDPKNQLKQMVSVRVNPFFALPWKSTLLWLSVNFELLLSFLFVIHGTFTHHSSSLLMVEYASLTEEIEQDAFSASRHTKKERV